MKRVKEILAQQNIDIRESALDKMVKYMDEILKLNEEINLTAITDRDEFIEKHFVDSLLAAGLSEFSGAARILDIGTGAGFPGIPLALAFEDKEFVLADSLNKRVKIIESLCEKLGIGNVKAVHGRAEDLAKRGEYRESFDICVSRAVAGMSTLSEYCLPFVKPGGIFVAYKGPDCEEEVAQAAKAIDLLGGGDVKILSPQSGEASFDHRLVIVRKVANTPSAYPRKAGTPAKKPL